MKKVLLPIFLMIALAMLATAAYSQTIIEPLAMNNSTLGGGAFNQYTPGVEGGTGLNNIGLLVRTWGRVTAVNEVEKYFYINDGANLADGTGDEGVRVSYQDLAPGNVIVSPSLEDFVAVTGISSTMIQPGTTDVIRPVLLPRDQSDID